MGATTRRRAVALIATLTCALATPLAAEDPPAAGDARTIPLPQTDRALLEQYFGQDVIGEPIAATTIDEPTRYISLEKSRTHWMKRVHGDNVGQTTKVEVAIVERAGRKAWRLSTPTEVLYGELDQSGSIVQHSSKDLTQSVLSRYTPAEPILTNGLTPGQSVKSTIQVGVYDLTNTADETHSGSLNLTYSYVGAYKVTVPAGTFDTILIRWEYDGKIGPASVNDSQYWFLAKGVGAVATLSRQDVSAFLFYNKNTKAADVLVRSSDHP